MSVYLQNGTGLFVFMQHQGLLHMCTAIPSGSPHTQAAASGGMSSVMVWFCDVAGVLQALAFLEVMQTSNMQIAPDTVTYNTVLKACCNAEQLDKAMQASLPVCCVWTSRLVCQERTTCYFLLPC